MKQPHLKDTRDEKAVSTQEANPQEGGLSDELRSASRSGPMSSISNEVARRGATWRTGSTRSERF